jgi:hypothetical protein
MNLYLKKKLAVKAPRAPGQLTAADFGELALSYLKRRQDAGKAGIKLLHEADRLDSMAERTDRAERGQDG